MLLGLFGRKGVGIRTWRIPRTNWSVWIYIYVTDEWTRYWTCKWPLGLKWIGLNLPRIRQGPVTSRYLMSSAGTVTDTAERYNLIASIGKCI